MVKTRLTTPVATIDFSVLLISNPPRQNLLRVVKDDVNPTPLLEYGEHHANDHNRFHLGSQQRAIGDFIVILFGVCAISRRILSA